MTPKQLVKSIYKSAYSAPFRRDGIFFADQRFIIKYRPSNNKLARAEAIGWGATRQAAWKDALDGINHEMLEKLEND